MLCWCSGRLTSATGTSPLPGKSWWQYTTGKVQGFVIELGPSRSKSFVFSIANLARQLLTACHSDLFIRGLASSRGQTMRTMKLALAGALSLIAVVAGPAHADTITTYTISFTTTVGAPAPVSGSFTYDSTNPQFTNFLVSWDGIAFDLTTSANSPSVLALGTKCTGEASTPSYGFMILSQSLSGCFLPQFLGYDWTARTGFTPVFSFMAFNAILGQDDISGFSGITTTPVVEAGGGWSIQPSTAPEPSSIILLGTGLLGLVAGARRKRLA